MLFDNLQDVNDVREIAETLGVAEATIRREIDRGRLECLRVGKRIKVTRAQFMRYVGESVNG